MAVVTNINFRYNIYEIVPLLWYRFYMFCKYYEN